MKLVVRNEYRLKDDVWRSDGNKMKNEYCKRIIWVKKEDRNKWGYGIIIIIVKIYKNYNNIYYLFSIKSLLYI